MKNENQELLDRLNGEDEEKAAMAQELENQAGYIAQLEESNQEYEQRLANMQQ